MADKTPLGDWALPSTAYSPPRARGDAVAMLTIYLVLLLAIPSNVRIAGLGSMGRPSLLWGLVLFGWWMLWRLLAEKQDLPSVRQPVKLAYFLLLTVALVSLSAALFRGQPVDQVSPAVTSILRLTSWGGALLVALDGLRTSSQIFVMIGRIAIGASVLAALGLAQFLLRDSLLGWISSVPGLEVEDGGVQVREAFVRASGTGIHPLEHAALLSAGLPLAIAVAMTRTQASEGEGRRWPIYWIPVAIISLGAILAVSRSALIGFAVAAMVSLAAVPLKARIVMLVGGGFAAAFAVAAVPGLFGVFRDLFSPSGDASTQSRTDALARLPEFVSASPIYGSGFGTFLPRYYIFDNAWVLMLVELGAAGLVALIALFATSIAGAIRAGYSSQGDLTVPGRTLAASVLSLAVVFGFFDAMSFPIAPGIAFILFGMCGAIRGACLASAQLPLKSRNRPATSRGSSGPPSVRL